MIRIDVEIHHQDNDELPHGLRLPAATATPYSITNRYGNLSWNNPPSQAIGACEHPHLAEMICTAAIIEYGREIAEKLKPSNRPTVQSAEFSYWYDENGEKHCVINGSILAGGALIAVKDLPCTINSNKFKADALITGPAHSAFCSMLDELEHLGNRVRLDAIDYRKEIKTIGEIDILPSMILSA